MGYLTFETNTHAVSDNVVKGSLITTILGFFRHGLKARYTNWNNPHSQALKHTRSFTICGQYRGCKGRWGSFWQDLDTADQTKNVVMLLYERQKVCMLALVEQHKLK